MGRWSSDCYRLYIRSTSWSAAFCGPKNGQCYSVNKALFCLQGAYDGFFIFFFSCLGGYPLRVYLWRLSLRNNFPTLSFPVFFGLSTCQYSSLTQQRWRDRWGTRVCFIIHVLFKFARCWPRFQLVALWFSCHLTILFSEVARCWPRFVLPLQRVVVIIVFFWLRLQLVVPGKWGLKMVTHRSRVSHQPPSGVSLNYTKFVSWSLL